MGAPLEIDRTAAQDLLDLVGACAELTAAALAAREARGRVVRLARRIVQDPTLTDEQAVTTAYPIANGFRLDLARDLEGGVAHG